MKDQTDIELNLDWSSYFFSEFTMLDLVAMASGFVVIAIFFNLAFNATKLYKSTKYPGTRLLMCSCWVLALMWVPLYLITYFFESFEIFMSLLTVITTVPMVTAAWGFRTYIGAVSRQYRA